MGQKINLAVFASTKGTDLEAIIDAIKSQELDEAELKFVLSNKKDCLALAKAKQAQVKTYFIDSKNKTRESFDQECLEICRRENIGLIVLIGYMRLISKVLLEAYPDKIMNIHPSLLPKYPGMDLDVHAEVLASGESETGCTLHFVDEGMDSGPIILQKKVPIAPGETKESLKIKVQEQEKKALIEGIRLFAQKKLKIKDRQVIVLTPPQFSPIM